MAGPLCSSFSAEACKLPLVLATLTSISLLRLSLCLHHTVFSFVFPFTSNSGKNCLLSPALSDYIGSADTRFSWGTTRLMSWPGWERYSCLLQSLVVSPLISRFLDWRYTVSSKYFDTHVPFVFTEELIVSRHAHCVLLSLRCNEHSLLFSSYCLESKILHAAPTIIRSRTPLILHCPGTDFLAPLIL